MGNTEDRIKPISFNRDPENIKDYVPSFFIGEISLNLFSKLNAVL